MGDDFLAIKVNGLDQLDDLRDSLLLSAAQMEGIVRRAINRTLMGTRAEGIRILKEETTLKSERVILFRKNVRLTYASGSLLVGEVTFFGSQGDPLHNYDVNPQTTNFKGVRVKDRTPAEGLSWRYRKGETYRVRTGPEGEKSFWITTRRNNRRMVVYLPKFWKRELERWRAQRGQYKKSKLHRTTMQERYKYKQQAKSMLMPLYAPSPVDALFRSRNAERLQDYAGDMLLKRIDHEMNREMRKLLT